MLNHYKISQSQKEFECKIVSYAEGFTKFAFSYNAQFLLFWIQNVRMYRLENNSNLDMQGKHQVFDWEFSFFFSYARCFIMNDAKQIGFYAQKKLTL